LRTNTEVSTTRLFKVFFAYFVAMDPINLIASRYLIARKNISLVSTLTIISVSGITIGTALLIVILSVFNGFFDVVKGLLLTYDPDIRIESTSDRVFSRDADFELLLSDIPEIVAIAPFISGKALLAHRGNEEKVVEVRGINSESFFEVVVMDESLSDEAKDLSVRNRLPGILLGDQLRSQLSITVDERLSLLSAIGIQRSLTQFAAPRHYTFEVRGSFYLQQVYEGSVVFVDLEAAQRMFGFRNGLSGYDIKITHHEDAQKLKNVIQAKIGPNYTVKTWYDLQKPLYDIMNIEKWSAYFILMLIVIVAVLNIVGSLTMIVIQKSRDIGILMSFGYTRNDIRRIFLRQGLLIGLIGTLLGGGLGLFISYIQKTYGLVKLAGAESFIINSYPVSINPFDVGLILTGSLILCLIASWYPARRASSLQPSEVLRYD
jgi:lipoprotein-releasing system permease protein